MVFLFIREYSPILTRLRIVKFLFLSNFPYVGLSGLSGVCSSGEFGLNWSKLV